MMKNVVICVSLDSRHEARRNSFECPPIGHEILEGAGTGDWAFLYNRKTQCVNQHVL